MIIGYHGGMQLFHIYFDLNFFKSKYATHGGGK